MAMKTSLVLLTRSKVVAINVEESFRGGEKEELGIFYLLHSQPLPLLLLDIALTPGLCLAGPLWKSNSGKSVGKPSSFQFYIKKKE